MTETPPDDHTPDDEHEDAKEPSTWHDYHWHDDLLESLVDITNASGLHLGITVLLGGKEVSGTLCSGEEYFETSAEEYEKVGNESADALAKVLRTRAKAYADADPENDDRTTLYFHMIDVVIDSDDRRRGIKVFRGRIAAVDGWTFGSVTKAPE